MIDSYYASISLYLVLLTTLELESWQFTPFALWYVFGALFSFVSVYLGWRMRSTRGAIKYSIHALATGIWSISYVIGFFHTDLAWKLIILRVEYLSMITGLVFFVLSMSAYTNYDGWINKYTLTALIIIPVITFIQVLLVEQHVFFYETYELATYDGLQVLVKKYGIGFYLWTAFAYICLLWIIQMLIRSIVYQPKVFQYQLFPISTTIAVFIFISVLYITGNNPIFPYDPTPLSVFVMSTMALILFTRFKFLDLVPAAHYLVFKNLASGVIVIDRNDRIIDLNPAAELRFGRSRKMLLGIPVTKVIPNYNKMIAEAFRSSEGKIEMTLGKREIVEMEVNEMRDTHDRNIGKIIMIHDITRLRQSMNELNAFAHMVAHDLKNPLNQQISAVALLDGEEDPNKKKMLYDGLKEGSFKMNEIIESILLLSDIQNMNKVELEPLDMRQIISNVEKRIQTFSEKHKAELHIQKEWPKCRGNAQWIEDSWANYINNAIKYGGNPPVVEIGADEDGDFVRCWVKDNGEGLSPKEQKEVFAEFNRLERHMKVAKGHGMGLAIVRRIMKRIGGRAGVQSDGHSGCTFYFTLPK